MKYKFKKLEIINVFSDEDKEILKQKLDQYKKDKNFEDIVGIFLVTFMGIAWLTSFILFLLSAEGIVNIVLPLCLFIILGVLTFVVQTDRIIAFVLKTFFHKKVVIQDCNEYMEKYGKWNIQEKLNMFADTLKSEPIGYTVTDISYEAYVNNNELKCHTVMQGPEGNIKEKNFYCTLLHINKNCHVLYPVLDIDTAELTLPADKKGNLIPLKDKEAQKKKEKMENRICLSQKSENIH